MTSPQRSLLPARGDDRGPFLCAIEFVAGSDMQFGEVVGAVVGQRIALEPGPQVFQGIEIGRVWRQIRDLDVTRTSRPDSPAPGDCGVPSTHPR